MGHTGASGKKQHQCGQGLIMPWYTLVGLKMYVLMLELYNNFSFKPSAALKPFPVCQKDVLYYEVLGVPLKNSLHRVPLFQRTDI